MSTLLESGDFDSIAVIANEHKQILSLLTAKTYHSDALIAWRAVQGLGVAARSIAEFDREYVRIHLRRLYWLLNDESGGIGWRAPEAIGEILSQCPEEFDEFISPLVNLLLMTPNDAERFRSGTLWAIGRVAAGKPGIIAPVLDLIIGCLHDPESQTRGMALWCLSQSGYSGIIPGLDKLRRDLQPMSLYLDGKITILSVAELSERFLN